MTLLHACNDEVSLINYKYVLFKSYISNYNTFCYEYYAHNIHFKTQLLNTSALTPAVRCGRCHGWVTRSGRRNEEKTDVWV